jgi:hypothetical protein
MTTTMNHTMEFLGTLAGNPRFMPGSNKQQTYGRKYESFGDSDDLKKKISIIGDDYFGKGYKCIGEKYNFTPLRLWDGRMFNTTKPSSMQGGGYFLTIKTYDNEDQERGLNCFAYALGTFGRDLEKLAGKEIKKIQESVLKTINHAVEEYFTNVDEPEDGDLVVYSVSPEKSIRTPSGIPISGTTHAGVYRKTKRNWNSPKGGSVESKWGWFGNPYVFQHDVFFTPDFYGDQVKFYRLKKLGSV